MKTQKIMSKKKPLIDLQKEHDILKNAKPNNKEIVNRQNDDEIIDIMRYILSHNMIVETESEAVLIRLMELRQTPIVYKTSFVNIDQCYQTYVEYKLPF